MKIGPGRRNWDSRSGSNSACVGRVGGIPEIELFRKRECGGNWGSKNPSSNFGTVSGEPIDRSDPNPHLRSDPLPADALRAQRSNPPRV
jgi:hypothetical protein